MKLEDVPAVIAVASGKGGVGKTTVAADVAKYLRDVGYNVGLVDADISTPNSLEVLGGEGVDLGGQRLSTHDSLIPPKVNGIQLVSQGVVLPDDVPVLRGGEWRAMAVADYVENVQWADDTDAVIVDTPPGTGEEIQTIAGAAPPDYGIVVTTPHPSSIRDARKSHQFLKQAEVDHDTVINMAYIPAIDVVSHVLDGLDFTEIQNVGESTSDSIRSMVEEGASDFHLFGYDETNVVEWGDVLATVPYTSSFEQRKGSYLVVEEKVAGIVDPSHPQDAPGAGYGGGD